MKPSFSTRFLLLTCLASAWAVSATAAQVLVWSDEFNGANGTAPNPNYWAYDTGQTGWGNNELENYTNSTANCYQDGAGHLAIKAVLSGGNYTSARIKTLGLFSLEYGRLEASMQIPKGAGLWPAFWSLGTNEPSVGWPVCGEIDAMESAGANTYQVFGHIHGPQSGTLDGDYNNGAGIGGTFTGPAGTDFSTGFHLYAVDWSPNLVQWSVDGTVYETLAPSNLSGSQSWVFNNQPFFIIMNLAVGGNLGGTPDPSVFPQAMLVDYVRVYNTASTPTGGTAAPVPGVVDADVWDAGGEGCAYVAVPGVSTEGCSDTSGNGACVNQTQPGEWLQYTVNVATTSSYRVDVRVASAVAGGNFHFAVDGVDCGISGDQFPVYTVPDTGADQAWTTVTVPAVNLTAGTHLVRLQLDAPAYGGSTIGNFNDFTFTMLGTPTITPTFTVSPSITPTFTPGAHGPVVANFESPPNNKTLWNSGGLGIQVDGYGSTLNPDPWTSTSATAGGAYGLSGFSGCISGVIAKSAGSNYPYCELQMELVPGGSAAGSSAPSTDVTPWCPTSALTFDYKAGAAGVGYTVSLITPDVGDYGYYQYSFVPSDTQWHTLTVYFPSATGGPKFAQPSFAAPQPFTETNIGAIQFSVNALTTTAQPYSLCVDNVTFGQGTIVSPTTTPSFSASPTVTPYAGTPTLTETPTMSPSATATHGPLVDNFENNAANANTLWNGGAVGTTADNFGSSLKPMPWTATSGTSGGGYGTSSYSGCISGTIAKSVGTNYPYCELYLELIPGGWKAAGPAVDVMPWALSQSLTFDYKGSAGIGYTVSLITPNVYDYGYYQYSFTPADANWHTLTVYFPSAAYTPSFAQPSYAVPLPFTPNQVGAIQFSVNALTTASQAYSLCVDNVSFAGGIIPSPTASPTPTSGGTGTATPSETPSVTGTVTKTVTASPSAAATGTPTPSPTGTATASATRTATGSATASPSATPSGTASATPTYAGSPTGTPTASLTSTVTLSSTVSQTWTVSPTQTQSTTASPSPTASPTTSATSTASPSATATGTATASPTQSATRTVTGTVTSTPTATASPTATPTPSWSATSTSSPTLTATPSITLTLSVTPTLTVTLTNTPGPSETASPTRTPTPAATAGPGPQPILVLTVQPAPNPQKGPQIRLAVKIQGDSSEMAVQIYSAAMVKLGSWQIPGAYTAGWNWITVPAGDLGNGLYYVQCQAGPADLLGRQVPARLVVLK